MIGRAFGNSPSAMPAWGGTRALFGTNPIAAVFPRRDGPPLSIDMSLSGMARGKGGQSHHGSQSRAQGLDAAGRRLKGAMLALVVELLVTALTGEQMGFEASSFFVEERGQAPDPGVLAGTEAYRARIEALLSVMLQDENVRLPGYRRHDLAHRAEQQGLEVSELTMQKLGKLASKS